MQRSFANDYPQPSKKVFDNISNIIVRTSLLAGLFQNNPGNFGAVVSRYSYIVAHTLIVVSKFVVTSIF